MTQFIIGLGSGRCGTRSLAKLLDAQNGVEAAHERKPVISWTEQLMPDYHLRLGMESGAQIFADIGFYYLPHVRTIMARHPAARFICLQRDREETVESFCRKHPHNSWWFTSRKSWGECFPDYPHDSMENLVSRYWDDYYQEAESLRGPQFEIFPTDMLNSESGVVEILTFAKIEDPITDKHFRVTDNQPLEV